jgi:hypothetical protein
MELLAKYSGTLLRKKNFEVIKKMVHIFYPAILNIMEG